MLVLALVTCCPGVKGLRPVGGYYPDYENQKRIRLLLAQENNFFTILPPELNQLISAYVLYSSDLEQAEEVGDIPHNSIGGILRDAAIPYEQKRGLISRYLRHRYHRGYNLNGLLSDGNPLISQLILENNFIGVKTLIDVGADCNQESSSRLTPLYIAAMSGQIQIFELLLASGANKDWVLDEISLLHRLIEGGNTDLVKLLVAAKVRLDIQNPHGETPLSVAAMHGHTEIVRSLIWAGANKNIPNKIGQTPLCIATIKGQTLVVQLLVNACAKKAFEEVTPHTEAVRLLL